MFPPAITDMPLGSEDINPNLRRANEELRGGKVEATSHEFHVIVKATQEADGVDPMELLMPLQQWAAATEGILDVEVHPAGEPPMVA